MISARRWSIWRMPICERSRRWRLLRSGQLASSCAAVSRSCICIHARASRLTSSCAADPQSPHIWHLSLGSHLRLRPAHPELLGSRPAAAVDPSSGEGARRRRDVLIEGLHAWTPSYVHGDYMYMRSMHAHFHVCIPRCRPSSRVRGEVAQRRRRRWPRSGSRWPRPLQVSDE